MNHILTSALLAASIGVASAGERPNILVISCEDISPYLGCYGDKVAVSPNLDNFAKESIRHRNMFTTMGVSAPSRYSLITGRFSSTDGANYMRSNFFNKDFEVVPPDGVKCFTEYLRVNGYYCTNNNKTDYQFRSPASAWDQSGGKAHWKNAPEGAPFYAVFNLGVTHESQIWKNADKPLAVDPDDIVVPPYYPDNDIVRRDMAIMYSNIALMDGEFQVLYQELIDSGKLDNTIVIFYADNGGPLPRGKREIMDSGARVPFMIRFPDGMGAGTVTDDLNMFVDIPATILSLAGVEVPDNLHGQAMYGDQQAKARKYAFGATDRFDEQIEKRAAIRDGQYLYIKNYMPEKSVYKPVAYRLQIPMMRSMIELYEKGELNSVQSRWFTAPAYEEELYDYWLDPHNINNLALDKDCEWVLKRMRKALQKEWIEPYNSFWVSSLEEDFIKRMHPEGVKPICPTPEYKIEGDKVSLVNADDALSILYKEGDGAWQLLANDQPLERNDKPISIKYCRIGYVESSVVEIQ